MDKEVLEELVKKKLDESGIANISLDDGVSLLPKGENYCGVILRYRLEIEHNSGKKSVKHLISKSIPLTENENKFIKEHSLFKNEIAVYSNIFPIMQKVMEEFEDRREKLWCEIIDYIPEEMLLMEDLNDSNFVMMNRRVYLDYDHSMLVMKSLGRYHAMSRILFTRGLLSVNDFPQLQFTTDLIMQALFSSGLKLLEEAVVESWGEEWGHLPEYLSKARDQIFEVLPKLIKFDESRFNVLNHGDCWTNNMFFKHVEGTKIPCDIRYLDFQMAHFNSFAWDLTSFLYRSTIPETRRANYEEFLTIYQQSLKDNLKFFNYPLDDVPTLEYVQDEMNRIRFYALCELASLHPIGTSDGNNVFDIGRTLQNLENPGEGMDKEMFKAPKYKDSVAEDFQIFINDGVI